jgi:uncharacterized membrane protein YhaH (DUF805 family)
LEELSPTQWALRPIRKYAVFSGRAARAEYWWFYLLTVLVGIPARLLDLTLGDSAAIAAIVQLFLFVPWMAVTVRRLHDTDRSGWWLLIVVAVFAAVAFVAVLDSVADTSAGGPLAFTSLVIGLLLVVVAVITLVVFMVLPGTQGSNRFGPDPYGPNDLEQVFA